MAARPIEAAQGRRATLIAQNSQAIAYQIRTVRNLRPALARRAVSQREANGTAFDGTGRSTTRSASTQLRVCFSGGAELWARLEQRTSGLRKASPLGTTWRRREISNAASLRAACEPAPLARPQARPVSGAVRCAALRSASALSAQVGCRACQAL